MLKIPLDKTVKIQHKTVRAETFEEKVATFPKQLLATFRRERRGNRVIGFESPLDRVIHR